MPSVLLVSPRPLETELRGTIVFRQGVDCYGARGFQEAQAMAVAARPELLLLDRDMPRAEELVRHLREEGSTRGISIGIVARGELELGELALLEAGANAVLRLPPDEAWDRRLVKLMSVPMRRDARLPVHLRLENALLAKETVGLARNLSVHGMLVEASVRMGVHDQLAFAFRLRGEDDEKVTGSGRVVRQAAAAQFGVEFEHLDYAGAARIQHFVTTLPL